MHEHLSDTELARFATDPESVPAERRQVIEREAAECAICRTSLDFFSVVTAEEMADLEQPDGESTWTSDDDAMRGYIERITAEDSEADELLADEKLLESPTKTAWKNLQRDKRLLTGGVVRRFVASANSVHLHEPLDALTFADAAISIAEALPDREYPWNAVFELRGAAWKERANALLVLGEYPSALEALTHAERAYQHLRSPGFGLSTVALVRASVFYEQGRLDEAAESAEKAEHGFAHIGQEERRMRAVFLRASISYEAGDVSSAVLLFLEVLEYGEAANSARWMARALYALGNCEVERGNLSEASMLFHKALVIFRELGPEWDRLATEWGLARVVLHGGNREDAVQRLRHVAAGYERRGMVSDGALVWLDIVEALVASGQAKQVVEIATRLFRIFKDAGMMTGALTALAYLKEAAVAGRLTSAGVGAVRTYLRRAGRQPELVFARPEAWR